MASTSKLEVLKEIIARAQSAAIAFSGGVDSTFLAKVAAGVPRMRLLLVTARSSTYPRRELEDAMRLAREIGVEHGIIESEETDIEEFRNNPPDRCYYCKHALFGKIRRLADERGLKAVFDGSNRDDAVDYRPGRRALGEWGVISPLFEAGLTKEDIRMYSRQLGLSTAEKPACACLASRFPYGETITPEKLERAGRAEEALRALGFSHFRVRSHHDCARIELAPLQCGQGWQRRQEISRACKDAGFIFVALDLEGYRMGAMNEALPSATRAET
jgi:pyridinium-3,5-biscarboxylic acid mononucleotide sulfurtransferase